MVLLSIEAGLKSIHPLSHAFMLAEHGSVVLTFQCYALPDAYDIRADRMFVSGLRSDGTW